MRARLKWLIAGVGLMYALQLVILLGVRHLVPHTGPYEF